MFNSIMLMFLGMLIAGQTVAQDRFQPAMLKDSKLSLQTLIDFPESVKKQDADLNMVLRCDAFVTRGGRISANFCFEPAAEYYPFVTAINKAAKSAVLTPARVDGTARKVYFQYYVVFMKKQGQVSIDVISNSGLEVEKYGFDYSSPQRYREGYGKIAEACGLDKNIVVKAVISIDGVPTAVNVEAEDVTEKCKQYLVDTFKEQRYIPAMFEGKPVSAYYSEKIFDNIRE